MDLTARAGVGGRARRADRCWDVAGAILGVWDGHDAGVALLHEGELVFALSEERPSRRKRFSGFPLLSLRLCLDWAGGQGIRIGEVALAGRYGRAPHRLAAPVYEGSDPHRQPLGFASLAAMEWESLVPGVPVLRRAERRVGEAAIARRVERASGRRLPVLSVAHHEAHAFSALLAPGREGALAVTWDAYGEGVSATLRRAEAPEQVISILPAPGGPALLYGAVTVALGFREGEEGKLTGLAARGDPGRLGPAFLSLFSPAGSPMPLRPLRRRAVESLLRGVPREDVSAGLQAATEELVLRQVRSWIVGEARPVRVLLAGGLFANVLVNRALARLPGLDGLWVFPHMGDGGLAAGAAHRLWHLRTSRLAAPLRGLGLGCGFGPERMRAAAAGLPARRVQDVPAQVADHLLAGRVVCRFTGRDELGPRALGNRSILFAADDARRGARVNGALAREAFMPFGPLVRQEDVTLALETVPPGVDLLHMTVAADATALAARSCPAAVHLDGTARPQVVRAELDPELHAILCAFRGGGGGPMVVNTSLNLHGEPIVHSPEDAVSTFLRSGLDVLFLGDLEVGRGE